MTGFLEEQWSALVFSRGTEYFLWLLAPNDHGCEKERLLPGTQEVFRVTKVYRRQAFDDNPAEWGAFFYQLVAETKNEIQRRNIGHVNNLDDLKFSVN